MIPTNLNNKYKTTLCQHWQTTGTCQIGLRCHFAHGVAELRSTNELGTTPTYGGMSNTKAIKCRYFELGLCQYGDSCLYGHNTENDMYMMQQQMMLQQMQQQQQQYYLQQQQMQTQGTQDPSAPSPVPTSNATAPTGGTSSTTPTTQTTNTYTIENDPNVQQYITIKQLEFIINKVEAIETNSGDVKSKLKVATELLKAQNIQSCSLILNEIINKPDPKEEQRKRFEVIIQDASQLAIEIMAQYQVQLQQMQNNASAPPTN